MLSPFLQATSIHGLRYLSESKSILARFLWLVCIVGCFFSALVIIYLNVVHWENSPAVITRVQPVLVEDSQILVPMITVCPRKQDMRSLIVNLFNKYYDRSDPAAAAFDEEVTKAVVAAWQDDLVISNQDEDMTFLNDKMINPFEICFPGDEERMRKWERQCGFVFLLRALVYASSKAKCKRDEYSGHILFVKEYLAHIVTHGIQPSLEHFQKMLEEDLCQTELEGYKELPTGGYRSKTMEVYALFFPLLKEHVTDETEKEDIELLPLQRLEDYELVPPPDFKIGQREDMGNLVGHLMKSDAIRSESLAAAIMAHLTRLIGKRLNDVPGVEDGDVDSLFDFLTGFTHDPDGSSFVLENADAHDITRGCQNMTKTCLFDDKIPKSCLEYCKMVAAGRRAEPFIQELFEMSVDDVNSLEENRPRSFLPDCNWKERNNGPCWMRVINDHGICFTNYMEGNHNDSAV